MEDYEPPEGMKVEKKGKGKAKGKKKKDPNAPKRGQSNFMFNSNEVQAKVKEENPDATFGQIVSWRKISLAWYDLLTNCCFV